MKPKSRHAVPWGGGRELGSALRFLLPSLAGVSVFVLVPFADAARRSVFDTLGGSFAGIRNFEAVLGNSAFQLAAKNTLIFLASCLPLLLVGSLLLAAGLHAAARPLRFCRTAFLLPMAVPAAAGVLLWRVALHENGFVNAALNAVGVQGPDWMNSGTAMAVLVGSYLWKNIGYDMILWLAGLCAISPELYDAAKADGAAGLQCFFRITLPLLRPTAYTVAVLSLLNSFKVFREAYLVAGSYPHDSIYLLQHLFNNWFLGFEMQKMCAGAVLMAAFMLVAVLILQGALGRDGNDCG